MHLTRAALKSLTGYSQPARMCAWLTERGWVFEAPFNGVNLWARPGDNPLRLVEAFYVELKKPTGVCKIAQAA